MIFFVSLHCCSKLYVLTEVVITSKPPFFWGGFFCYYSKRRISASKPFLCFWATFIPPYNYNRL